MNLIKLGLDRMALPDKVQFTRQVTQNMTGNPNFPTPDPALPDMATAADASETAYNDARTARQVAKSKTSIQDDREAELDWLLTQLAAYVEKASDGDKAKIESAGFSLRNPPAPVGPLPAPTDVQVVASAFAGSADLSWQLDRDARLFLIERAEDAVEPVFRQIATATKKSASVNSMVSGKKYLFRLAAVGPAGQGPWSEPVSLFAP